MVQFDEIESLYERFSIELIGFDSILLATTLQRTVYWKEVVNLCVLVRYRSSARYSVQCGGFAKLLSEIICARRNQITLVC